MGMKCFRICAIAATIVSAIGCCSAEAAQVLLLDDFGDAGSYLTFFGSKGQTTGTLSHGFSAASLAGTSLVIANMSNGYSSGELAALNSYVVGGGRLVISSEGGGFPFAINSANAVYGALGSSVVNDFGGFDGNFHNTTNIAASPFTNGVASINYAYSSGLSGGTPLVFGVSNQTLVAFQQIGSGYVFGVTDSNLSTNILETGNDNGQLFLNFENASISAVPEPSTWAMMILGFASVAFIACRRKTRAALVSV
jgi:hypothetical protein